VKAVLLLLVLTPADDVIVLALLWLAKHFLHH
jgi:hypothetical protein